MFLNQTVTAGRVAVVGAGLAYMLCLGGCAGSRGDAPQAPAERVTDTRTEPSAAAEPQTATDAATAIQAQSSDETAAPPGSVTTVIDNAGSAVKANAPKSYLVKRGDTLWGIAGMFLRNPWQWPEIWYVNPQIRNPHRIYPGDTVQLAYGSDGRVAALQLVRGAPSFGPQQPVVSLSPLLRSVSVEGPIQTIPYSDIASFLSHPAVLGREEIRKLPYVLALRNDHVAAGEGSDLYVKDLRDSPDTRYNVMHLDSAIRDPDTGKLLGYMAIYAGAARMVQPGKVAKVVLTQSSRETLVGDVLVPQGLPHTSDFVPRAPTRRVDGQVAAVVNNVLLAGRYNVVALNRGAQDGLDRGSVLTVDQAGDTVKDNCVLIDGRSDCTAWRRSIKLPAETSGSLLVFKTYPHMSYALVVADTDPIQVGDAVHNP